MPFHRPMKLAVLSCPRVDGKDLSNAAQGKDEGKGDRDALLLMKPLWLSTNWITNGNGPWRGVRTHRYTYARKSDSLKPWMLFDNEADPCQMKNLVEDPFYASLVKKLDKRTNELLVTAGDPENPLFFANLIEEERKQHGQPSRRRAFFPVYTDPGSGFKSFFQ